MKTIFWNVDTQYDFMKSEGKLAVQGAEGIEKNLAALTGFAREQGYQIINTADFHNKDSEELSDNPDFMNTFPEHCMRDSFGAKYINETMPKDPYVIDWENGFYCRDKVLNSKEIVMYKDKFDIFSGNPFSDLVVKTINPDRAIVYGVATNVCVDQAVNGLLDRNISVYVPTDAIKELPIPGLEKIIQGWEKKGAKLVTTKDVLSGAL